MNWDDPLDSDIDRLDEERVHYCKEKAMYPFLRNHIEAVLTGRCTERELLGCGSLVRIMQLINLFWKKEEVT